MAWSVELHAQFVPEFEALPEDVQDELLAHVTVIETFGPQLGRPRVDTLHGSRYANMKELRFAAAGGVWRFAFAFDLMRRAVILCGGDKAGGSQSRFYRRLIAVADRRFAAHAASIRPGRRRPAESKGTTMSNLDSVRARLGPARRRKIAARAVTLVAHERSLQELRREMGVTQTTIAQALGVGQDGVSRLEQRHDMRLSTLRGYVEALGGRLSVVAEFPGQEPVVLGSVAKTKGDALSGRRGVSRRRRDLPHKPR